MLTYRVHPDDPSVIQRLWSAGKGDVRIWEWQNLYDHRGDTERARRQIEALRANVKRAHRRRARRT